MKTDELIDLLGANVEPVKRGYMRTALLAALAVGAAAAFCLRLAVYGVPANPFSGEDVGLKVAGLALALSLVVVGGGFLIKSARPGEAGRGALIIIGLLLLAIFSAGTIALALASPSAWSGMVFGPQWAACFFCIPVFAALPFATLVWALRKAAPTRLALTGAVIGLVAGALGAAVCAYHYPSSSIPFLAFWYGGPIVLCGLIGALLGPRLLRW
ncbi:MAG TPA: DUF1109 domain-containing protein [Roseiarcus sp.]|nr:DUF1109 domain-containing protein [Roseiarcus sp.]